MIIRTLHPQLPPKGRSAINDLAMLEHLGCEIAELLKGRNKDIITDWELRPSAVLVPLFSKEGHLHMLFTKRTNNLRNHPGQISFPGGRRDESDASLLETALRETEEELGLSRDQIKVLGELDDMMTSTQYRITPFVGIIPYPYKFSVNSAEIEQVIEVPIPLLLDPTRQEVQNRTFYGKVEVQVYYYHIGAEPIWGATARIVKHFLEVIYPLLSKHVSIQTD
ncbi:MAG: CoA pyrophosphatase [Acidobacteriota bacterium]